MAGIDGVRRVARRSYWRESDARVVVEAWRGGGGSLASFCRRYGLRAARVGRWVKRLGRAETVGFHPVQLVGRSDSPLDAGVEVELGRGVTVRLAAGFAVDDLRHVLLALDERNGC